MRNRKTWPLAMCLLLILPLTTGCEFIVNGFKSGLSDGISTIVESLITGMMPP